MIKVFNFEMTWGAFLLTVACIVTATLLTFLPACDAPLWHDDGAVVRIHLAGVGPDARSIHIDDVTLTAAGGWSTTCTVTYDDGAAQIAAVS